MFRKQVAMLIAATLFGTGVAFAQDNGAGVGAGRVEIAAIPIGGVVFLQPDGGTQPKFNNYVLGASATGNINRWVGIEGDLNFAVGRRQDLTFNGASLLNQKTPNLWQYSGNVIVNPGGSDHMVVPYLAGGLGGLTMLNTTDAASLGVTTNQTYLTTNVGGGVRFFPMRHWGIRGDYRFIMIHNNDGGPAFFTSTEDRHANRVYGSFILTF